ncbi:hypothetical protein B9Z55_028654 [Caenorhabditis nigoni]|uniref:Uncharacterized protein n=1 Tax=Caenorhabditis nigoni TaxID=1611254 RepID=A0A2G5SB18_9PELO|nr:hypothetical protein B9Z55_028654 [Caenorhabditis nigoni]
MDCTISSTDSRLKPLSLNQSTQDYRLHRRRSATSSTSVWGIGLLFVTLTNMCAVVGIDVMRYLTKDAYNQIITLLVGLGVGSLSDSSFYHLVRQAHPALMDENSEPTHSYLHMAHISIVGVYAFFFCDKLIKIILEMRKKNQHIHHRRLSNENTEIMNTERNYLTLGTDAGYKEERMLRSVLKKVWRLEIARK